MPKEDFYQGLTLSEQLRKFADYHYDPKERHISAFEAGFIQTASERISETISIATEKAKQDLQQAYESVYQIFSAILAGDAEEGPSIGIGSLPVRGQEASTLLIEFGLSMLAENPTVRETQAAVAALLIARTNDELRQYYVTFSQGSRDLETTLGSDQFGLINKLLYYPTVPAQNSWTDIKPLLEHLEAARKRGAEVVVFSGVMLETHDLVLALLAGGSIILLRALNSVLEGMEPGLKGMGEKLTGRWGPEAGTTTGASKGK